MLLEIHQTYTAIGGKGNKHGVDEKQVEGTEEIKPMAGCQSVASGTQRGHQGGGDGHTGDDVALTSGTQGDDARSTATEGYEHIIERGRGACQQLR